MHRALKYKYIYEYIPRCGCAFDTTVGGEAAAAPPRHPSPPSTKPKTTIVIQGRRGAWLVQPVGPEGHGPRSRAPPPPHPAGHCRSLAGLCGAGGPPAKSTGRAAVHPAGPRGWSCPVNHIVSRYGNSATCPRPPHATPGPPPEIMATRDGVVVVVVVVCGGPGPCPECISPSVAPNVSLPHLAAPTAVPAIPAAHLPTLTRPPRNPLAPRAPAAPG